MSTAALDPSTLILNGQDAGKHHADLVQAVTSLRLSETITGASTLEVTVSDPHRTLLQAKALASRSMVVLDRAGFELVKVSKSGSSVTLTFEDAAVAALRRHNSVRKAAAGTTTRADFVRTLIREEPDIRVVVAGGASRNLVELSRGSGATTGQAAQLEDTWTAAGRIMGEVGWRVFARHGTVTVAPDSWLVAHNGAPYALSPTQHGVLDIDFDWDVGKPAASATVTVNADIHDLTPGSPLALSGLGAGDGPWLVETVDRTLVNKQATVTAIRKQPTLPEPKAEKATRAGGMAGDGGTTGFNFDFLGDEAAPKASPSGRSGGGLDAATSDKLENFVRIALAQKGLPYVFGASGPAAFDCSGLVQWCAAFAGIGPMPKPVSAQAAKCRAAGTTIPLSRAALTRGALIWRQRGGGAHDHIVISLGDGRNTIEAMGRAYGVRIGNIKGRDWTGAGLIPGTAIARGD